MNELLKNRIESVVRQTYMRLFSGSMPFYVINEFPKSGGTWIGQMLGDALQVDFPRHCMPTLKSSILHGHFIHPLGINNAACVWRDGRDVMVSWYHHCLYKYGFGNDLLVEKVSDELGFVDRDDIVGNLPRFIEYSFTKQRHPSFSWSEFVQVWYLRQGVVQVKYENFRINPVGSLCDLVVKLTNEELDVAKAEDIADQYSFEKMSGRKTGQESKSNFMRKGIVGDWKSSFSQEAKEVFDHFAGEELIMLGYESDRKWVGEDKCSK